MKKIFKIGLASILVASAPILSADNYSPNAEITHEFFLALQNCIPGTYKEKNSLSATVGPMWLAHTIIGSEDGFCQVNMQTPDDRVMQCSFPIDTLSVLSNQHFLQGILNDDPNDPSQDSVDAQNTWTEIKTQNCGF